MQVPHPSVKVCTIYGEEVEHHQSVFCSAALSGGIALQFPPKVVTAFFPNKKQQLLLWLENGRESMEVGWMVAMVVDAVAAAESNPQLMLTQHIIMLIDCSLTRVIP